MCNICHSIPCRPQCPNAEPEQVYTCDLCETPIYEGDDYYDIVSQLCICGECIAGAKRTAEAIE